MGAGAAGKGYVDLGSSPSALGTGHDCGVGVGAGAGVVNPPQDEGDRASVAASVEDEGTRVQLLAQVTPRGRSVGATHGSGKVHPVPFDDLEQL